jgi:hypothetical protein
VPVGRFSLVTAYIRCARCLEVIGSTAPVMGHAVYGAAGDEWMFDRWQRRSGNRGRPRHSDADTDEVFIPGGRSRGIELRCRRCGYAPRVALRRLRELASNAHYRSDPKFPGNGRADIYL